jgi:hypothetical protein
MVSLRIKKINNKKKFKSLNFSYWFDTFAPITNV